MNIKANFYKPIWKNAFFAEVFPTSPDTSDGLTLLHNPMSTAYELSHIKATSSVQSVFSDTYLHTDMELSLFI